MGRGFIYERGQFCLGDEGWGDMEACGRGLGREADLRLQLAMGTRVCRWYKYEMSEAVSHQCGWRCAMWQHNIQVCTNSCCRSGFPLLYWHTHDGGKM